MANVLIPAGSIPRILAVGTWHASVLNGGRWRLLFIPGADSTDSVWNGFLALLGNGLGGFWIRARNFEIYNQSGTSGTVISRPGTWVAGQNILFLVDFTTGTGEISGASTGNGPFSFTPFGVYFDAAQTLGIGVYNGGGFSFVGSIGDLDDGAPDAVQPGPALSVGILGLGQLTGGDASLSGTSLGGLASAETPSVDQNTARPAVASVAGALISGSITAEDVSLLGNVFQGSAIAFAPNVQERQLDIGERGMDAQLFGHGSGPSEVTLTLTPGSMVLTFSGGNSASTDVGGNVTTSQGDVFSLLDQIREYPDFPGYGTSVRYCANVAGGVTTLYQPVQNFEESTFFVVEVKGAGLVRALAWTNQANAGAGTTQTSAAVQAAASAVNLTAWWGSGPVFNPSTTPFTAVPDVGTIVLAYLINNPDGEVQGAIAGRLVAAGSHSTTWTHSPPQGAQIWNVLLETDLTVDIANVSGALPPGVLVPGTATLTGTSLTGTATADRPDVAITIEAPRAACGGGLGEGVLQAGDVTLTGNSLAGQSRVETPELATLVRVTDVAETFGGLGEGVLQTGEATLAGNSLTSTSRAETPDLATLIRVTEVAESLGSLGGGALQGAAILIEGVFFPGIARGVDPVLRMGGLIVLPLPAEVMGRVSPGNITPGPARIEGVTLEGTAQAVDPQVRVGNFATTVISGRAVSVLVGTVQDPSIDPYDVSFDRRLLGVVRGLPRVK